MAKPRCICCGARAVHRHHAIYAQAVQREGGDTKDERNLVWVAFSCHGNHHAASKRFELRMLPDSVYEFGFELMGPAAYDWLRRRYVGEDPRLEALLSG